jgi:pyruvate/2-oxoglutarate dehydrogenase complex dihydrolipoamide acyltransferase (E2) component
MDRLPFVRAFQDLQRKAMAHHLAPEESQGATLGFTSMERWQVTRHVPVLPPHVSLMVAHTTSRDGQSVLGATYDHRILSGADVIAALRHLFAPADAEGDGA